MFYIVIVSILIVAYIGLRYFYVTADNAVNMGSWSAAWQALRGFWERLDLAKRLWQSLLYFLLLMRHQRLLALILLVVVVSVGITLALGGRHWLERPSEKEIQFASNARLAFLEEKLVPPPPLPPSIFLGSDRPALESADRDWSKLQPVFRQELLMLLARLSAQGYDFALLEGYRSPERQEMLAALGPHLTQARAYESRHQYGLAADLAPIRNGVLVFNVDDPWAKAAYSMLGQEARMLGLVWGGGWKLQDYGHVEQH
jgi:peptidoglycan L-alanyl-D-glutamate endopeptidase CwlK